MPQIPLVILHHHLQRLIKAPMDQAPHMLDIRAESEFQPPLAGAQVTALRRIGLDIRVDALPVLHLAVGGNAQLEAAGGRLVIGAPVVLYHDGRGVGDALPEHLAGCPLGVGAGVVVDVVAGSPEHLHLAAAQHGDYVEVTYGVGVVRVYADVGLHEGGAALQDVVGDEPLEAEIAGGGGSLPLLCLHQLVFDML